MKIYTKITMRWDGHRYITVSSEDGWYEGPVALCCGATAAQNQALGQQTAFAQTMQQQASSVFGNSSQVFKDLVNTFSPTVAAGPSQEGFSAAEKSSLQSAAITNTGQAYRNAAQAVGQAQAAQGGGNTPDVTGGAKVGTDLGLATSAAAQTSGELNQINQADYQTGRENYDFAAKELSGSTGAFNPATGMSGAADNALSNESKTANDIATMDNSWVQSVTGALGGVAASAAKWKG